MSQQTADVVFTTATDIQGAQSEIDRFLKGLHSIQKPPPIPIEVDTSEANKSLKELLSVEKAERFRGWLGDIRDAWDLAGKELTGLSEKQAKAISEAGYLVEKGIAVGSAFGVGGAVAGAAIGGLAGFLLDIIKTSEAKRKKVIEDFKMEEKVIGDAIDKVRDYNKEFNVSSGAGHYQKTLSELENFRVTNTKTYNEAQSSVESYIKKLKELAKENKVYLTKEQIEPFLQSNKDAADMYNHIMQLQADQSSLNMEMLARTQQSTSSAMADVLELGNRASKDMSAGLDGLTSKQVLAKTSTADLKAEVDKNKNAMQDAAKSTNDWRTKLEDIPGLVLSGKFDSAAKLIKDAAAWINFNTGNFDEAKQKVLEGQGEIDARRAKGQAKALEATRDLISIASELSRVSEATRGDASKTSLDALLHISEDTKSGLEQAKQNVLELTVDYIDLAQQRGEGEKAYLARIKETLGLSKTAKDAEVKAAIEVELVSIESLGSRLDAAQDYAGREEKVEEQKVSYYRALRELDRKERDAEAKERLAMLGLELDAEKALLVSHLADKPKFYQGASDVLAARDLERDAILEQIELRGDLLKQSAKTASEIVKIEADAAKERANIDKELADYRNELLEGYTEKYSQILQPIVDISTSIAEAIGANITNERKAFEGLPLAIRKSVGEVLKEKARLWVGNAAEQGAASLASLAIGDFKGAGLHGAAAVGYLAAAAIAGYAGARLTPKAEERSEASQRTAGNSSLGGGATTRELAPVVVYLTGPNGTLVIPTSDPHNLADLGDLVMHSVDAARARQGN